MQQDNVTKARQELLRYPNIRSVDVGYLPTANGQQTVALKAQLIDSSQLDSVPAIINGIPVDIVE